jgi:hypothetical protein
MQINAEGVGVKLLTAQAQEHAVFEFFDRKLHVSMRAIFLFIDVFWVIGVKSFAG